MPELQLRLGVTEDAFKGKRSYSESIPLHLPSSIPHHIRGLVCSEILLNTERQLREAEAYDALEALRNRLRTKTFMTRFKTANVSGQRSNTRARVILSTIDVRIFLLKHRYRRARAALLSLVGLDDWCRLGLDGKLRELTDDDVRGLGDAVLKEAEKASVAYARQQAEAGLASLQTIRALKQHSESGRTLSWIWTSVSLSADGSDPGLNDGTFLSPLLGFRKANSFVYTSCPRRMGESQSPSGTLD